MMDSAAPLITPSEVMEYLYCPRFTYFLNVLKIRQYEEKRYKVQKGREVHQQRLDQNPDYIRKKIPMLKKEQNVYLSSDVLHVRGIVDEIIYLKDGSLAPADYKFTIYQPYLYNTHKIQTALYALLIRENYQKPVHTGYIFYLRGGSKMHEVAITAKLERESTLAVVAMLKIIQDEQIPKRTSYRVRCADCCYKNICV
ncbi:CRISPR-associated protein Cas4 [bacterium]|nr:CRISPR-associated protein Cas4 [bacterium]